MKAKYLFSLILIIPSVIFASVSVNEINLLEKKGLQYNGLGALLVRADVVRNRIIQVNTISSSVTIIDEKSGSVTNITVKKRVPQYLKEEALAIDKKTGNVYSIADHAINIVFPDSGKSVTFDTESQYEMVAVDSLTGNCLLVGKTDERTAYVDIKRGKIRYKKLFNTKGKIKNLNQTPPPPPRKVVFDDKLNRFFVYDGYTKRLSALDGISLKTVSRRSPDVKTGARLHFAGYDDSDHFLYLVIETSKRRDVQAVRLDCNGSDDGIIELPGLTEAVGVKLNREDKQVYIPYDNHLAVHIADFKKQELIKVDLPSFGNDASAFDRDQKRLFIASWAFGEIYVVDLKTKKLVKRVRNMGIIPHMFNIAYSPVSKNLYIPLGASAVNGTFGAALTVLNVDTYKKEKIRTGWGPVDIAGLKESDSFLVFGSEDEFVKISENFEKEFIKLPALYPSNAVSALNGNIYVSYGPHQSYWPVVYIWGAKNGIFEIDKNNLQIYDRRIGRLAQRIVTDKRGGLWGTQNSWGKEKIFLSYFPSGIRQFAPQKRVYFYKYIERENSLRVLKYDKESDLLFMAKTAETDEGTGLLLVINPVDEKLVASIDIGPSPTDIAFNRDKIFVTDFSSGNVAVVDRKDYRAKNISSGKGALKMAVKGDYLYVINHIDNSLLKYKKDSHVYKIPFKGSPDNIVTISNELYITSHSPDSLVFYRFDPKTEGFVKQFDFSYPYGDTSFDTSNSAFFQNGQFADSIFELSKIKSTGKNEIVVSDFLSGRIFRIKPD